MAASASRFAVSQPEPVFVDRPVEIAPFAANFDVGLIDADRAAMRPSKTPQSFLDQRRIGQDLAVDRAVIDLEAAFQEHAFEIVIAQGGSADTSHRLNDQPGPEMTVL